VAIKVIGLEIKNLIDNEECYRHVRQLRWPENVRCPHCQSQDIIKRGKDDTDPFRQRYECHTLIAGHNGYPDAVKRTERLPRRRRLKIA